MNQPEPSSLYPAAIAAILAKLEKTGDLQSVKADLETLAAAKLAVPVNPDPLLDLKESAAYMGCTPRMARVFAQQQRMPVVRIGNRIRFRRSDLDTFLANGGAIGRGKRVYPLPAK